MEISKIVIENFKGIEHVELSPVKPINVVIGRNNSGKSSILTCLSFLNLSVPPRYSIAMTVGYLKGKSAIRTHRDLSRVKGTLFGRSFWARGYCVSTVGLDESAIRRYIQDQEQHQQNQEQDQLNVT